MRVVLCMIGVLAGLSAWPVQSPAPDLVLFVRAASADPREADRALTELARVWRPGYTANLVDLARFLLPPRPTNAGTGSAP